MLYPGGTGSRLLIPNSTRLTALTTAVSAPSRAGPIQGSAFPDSLKCPCCVDARCCVIQGKRQEGQDRKWDAQLKGHSVLVSVQSSTNLTELVSVGISNRGARTQLRFSSLYNVSLRKYKQTFLKAWLCFNILLRPGPGTGLETGSAFQLTPSHPAFLEFLRQYPPANGRGTPWELWCWLGNHWLSTQDMPPTGQKSVLNV